MAALAEEEAEAAAKEKKRGGVAHEEEGGEGEEDEEAEEEKEREEEEALEEDLEKEMLNEGLDGDATDEATLHSHDTTTDPTAITPDGRDQREGGDDDEGSDESDVEDVKGAPTPSFEVVVLEISKKRASLIPLGLTVEKIDHLHGAKIFFRGKGTKTIVPHCALHILDVDEDAPASISNAYQNEILRIGDFIVGINDVYPKNINVLIQATEKSQKRRVINVVRPKQARDTDLDVGDLDTIAI